MYKDKRFVGLLNQWLDKLKSGEMQRLEITKPNWSDARQVLYEREQESGEKYLRTIAMQTYAGGGKYAGKKIMTITYDVTREDRRYVGNNFDHYECGYIRSSCGVSSRD